ncbi:GNAT family N-acetyltransferase [Dissulfurirhabdus thermomarina]|uniref:GNAT family N-acetyltransferase n=1 Tax=Dissulfurirhabdus thermomarina TaxID=1765737 RepID=A0A6N9TPS1_DISTH|nr:GNAT family N-acetyltransferase [Dissulfurirhabdus thermomarina]NMX23670.1 GNAT family N-acetyltransferase [Dissulfurirhabdus thermomarina]
MRPARPADLDHLLRIERRCHPAPWSAAALAAELGAPRGRLWMAETLRGRAAGFVAFHWTGDVVYVADLAVDPAFRRRGIGAALLGLVLRWARRRGAVEAVLEVREAAPEARAFYDAQGFTAAGRRPDLYGRGHHGLTLVRRLRGGPGTR